MDLEKLKYFLENEPLIKQIKYNNKSPSVYKDNRKIIAKIINNSNGLIKNNFEFNKIFIDRNNLFNSIFFNNKCAWCGKTIDKLSPSQYIRKIKDINSYVFCCTKCQTNYQKKFQGNPWNKKEIQIKCKTSRQKEIKNNEGIDNVNQRHILNFNLINEKFWRENFIENNIFNAEKCINFHNITISCVNKYKRKFNILEPTKLKNTKIQNKIYNWIKDKNVKVYNNVRTIIKHNELDIYLPNYNLAIEFDGLMYHSYGKNKKSVFNNFLNDNKYYHITKTNKCLNKNIKLLHIFENEWNKKEDIWKHIILSNLNIIEELNSDLCIIKNVNNKDKNIFLNKNHLLGACKSSINLGLYYNNKLVYIVCIKNKNNNYIILRHCSILKLNIKNALRKILFYFINNYNENIKIIVDKRFDNKFNYQELGFKLIKEIDPNTYYFLPNQNILYTKKQLKNKLKDKLKNFNNKLSFEENLYNNNYRKIYDCGNDILMLEKLCF